MAQAQSKQAINPSEKKTASITYKRGKEMAIIEKVSGEQHR